MSFPTTTPIAFSGALHIYAPKLRAFEYTPQSVHNPAVSASVPSALNTLLFIGGLGDDLLRPSYVHESLVPGVYSSKLGSDWRVAEVAITSSGVGWGTGSVKRDAEELAQCVKYFRGLRPDGKIVLMGHSTGCQDIIYLLTRLPNAPQLDGIILQASVSDREALHTAPRNPHPSTSPQHPLAPPAQSPASTSLLTIATTLATTPVSPNSHSPGPKTILPIELTAPYFGFNCPINAARWYSLTAPPDPVTKKPRGEEDFFSSDTPDRWLAFADIPRDTGVLILYSEEDEWVPVEIDKRALVERWVKLLVAKGVRVDEEGSGVVEEATHDLEKVEEAVRKDVVDRVVAFLGKV
ncbi:hypothetical protein DFH27DRAFT_374621 [Peziza echinospora]|nr:hypothetical protein DFH27DRAFT_374621 [Peziza echinospora]